MAEGQPHKLMRLGSIPSSASDLNELCTWDAHGLLVGAWSKLPCGFQGGRN